MKIIVPQIVKDSISKLGNKTAQKNGLKIYAALYINDKRKNNQGYFPVPCTYLEKINSRYYRYIQQFIKDGIIEYFKNIKQDPNNIFNTLETKYYNKERGICMRYKFLINIKKGDMVDVEFKSDKQKRWYTLTKSSLISLGYEPKISRDSFGRRVHHTLTTTYKKELQKKGYYVIDSVTSQPRLLYLMMVENNIIDNKYNSIFESDIDFYDYLVVNLNLNNRDEAKDLFMYWLNSDGYVPNYKIHFLFPIASNYIKTLKSKYYKDSCSLLQRYEAKIWIDDLLENLPTNFGLSIHDSLIVHKNDIVKVLEYCRSKYPKLKFTTKEL